MDINFYEYFYEAFYGDNKYSIITSRRREGKTMHSIIWLGSKILSEPNIRCLWVDTVQANLDKYYERIWYPVYGQLFKKNILQYNKQSKIITSTNGSTLDMVSAERPTNIEGFSYDYIVCNEAGLIFKKSSLWDNTIAPMTKNSKKVIIIGTPKSRNKFFELAQKEKTSKDWKTYRINPDVSFQWSKEELEENKRIYPENVYRQEYCGEFLESGAGVFRVDQVDNTLSPNRTISLGLDLGRHHDETVLIGLDSNCKTTFIESWQDTNFEVQKPRIINTWIKLGRPKVYIDMTGLGLPVFDALQIELGQMIEGISFTNTTKKNLIENAQLLIEQKRYIPFNNTKLLDQLRSYEYDVTKGGGTTYNAPDGEYDDYVISLSLALLEFKQSKTNFGLGFIMP